VENLLKKNSLLDLLSNVNAVISTNKRIEFITAHCDWKRGALKDNRMHCGLNQDLR
jgi:hypothetical protein